MTPPKKPFANYKWRWAVLTPTESLNDPPVFLGVLRAFRKFNNYPPGSEGLLKELQIVKDETRSTVDLVRDSERNLVRNSGQYWKALGLLEKTHGRISLSSFGILLADGKISQSEFAATIIKTLKLPNSNISSDLEQWQAVGLEIKPLELIINILNDLNRQFGPDESFIKPNELIKIIIPLAGEKTEIGLYARAIVDFRRGVLNISNWPDCAPQDNDKRMAREFLLFLSNYSFCRKSEDESSIYDEKYVLSNLSRDEVLGLNSIKIDNQKPERALDIIRLTQIPANIERTKVTREILDRRYQAAFRKNVLAKFGSTCIITGVSIENVLEAAHIKPVKYNGDDSFENGLCMRSDIHQLYDSNNLKILTNGTIILSDIASSESNYNHLPRLIKIPGFINHENVYWRNKYY
jgi:hypothetical protein